MIYVIVYDGPMSFFSYLKEVGKKKKRPDKEQKPGGKNKTSEARESDCPSEEGSAYGGLPDRDLKKNLGCGG